LVLSLYLAHRHLYGLRCANAAEPAQEHHRVSYVLPCGAPSVPQGANVPSSPTRQAHWPGRARPSSGAGLL